jgi:hypothetical protein
MRRLIWPAIGIFAGWLTAMLWPWIQWYGAILWNDVFG